MNQLLPIYLGESFPSDIIQQRQLEQGYLCSKFQYELIHLS